MPTVMSHAVAGLAIASAFPAAPRRIWLLAAACAVLPDLDVAGFGYGIRYDDLLGHRGLSHSLLFAAALATLLRAAAFPRQMPGAPHVWTCLLLATASHGVLDALTDGGLGIAFFAPFDDGRYHQRAALPVRARPGSAAQRAAVGRAALGCAGRPRVGVAAPLC
jgi:inner membrane protein